MGLDVTPFRVIVDFSHELPPVVSVTALVASVGDPSLSNNRFGLDYGIRVFEDLPTGNCL